jgi:hypothetical protein
MGYYLCVHTGKAQTVSLLPSRDTKMLRLSRRVNTAKTVKTESALLRSTGFSFSSDQGFHKRNCQSDTDVLGISSVRLGGSLYCPANHFRL